MRTSKKSQLIQAALEIIDRKSLDALTYDSLAKASGMSKSGLLYHFPSRTALLLALDTHTREEGAEVWDEILGPWLLPREEILADPDIYLLYIIADGLWVHDHINSYDLTTQERRALITAALAYLDSLPDVSQAHF